MTNRILTPFALAATAGALFVAGCGGGDDSSTSTSVSGATGVSGAALSQDELVSQGNAICKDGNKALDAASSQAFSGGQPSQAEIEQYVSDTMVPNIQGQIDALAALTPPEDIAEDYQTFLDDA